MKKQHEVEQWSEERERAWQLEHGWGVIKREKFNIGHGLVTTVREYGQFEIGAALRDKREGR